MEHAGGVTTTRAAREPRGEAKLDARPAERRSSTLFRFAWLAPDDRWWLEAYHYDGDGLFSVQGSYGTSATARRETIRLAHPLASDSQSRLVLKRSRRVGIVERLRSAARRQGAVSRQRREWEVLRQLHALGFMGPRPLACVEEFGRAALLLEDLEGARPLPAQLLDASWQPDADERREFFQHLGREIGRLHATGYAHGSLSAPAVLAIRQEGAARFGFQHVAKARQFRRLSLARRAAELAMLDATLPERIATAEDRQRLVEAYIHEACIEGQAGDLLELIAKRRERLLARRDVWEIRERFLAGDDLVPPTRPAHLWIDPAFRPALESTGLASLPAVMETKSGKCLRVLKDRENWRLDLPHVPGPPGAYLKKHHIRTMGSWLRAKLGRGPGDTAGRVEARNIALLRRAGIAAMRLIAFGEQLLPNGELQSFVLTQELAGYLQLDHYLKQRVASAARRTPTEQAALRVLVDQVAELAGKFHRLGYNHRDLYCCHFFVKPESEGRFQINLIDLQRVEHRRWLRRRWIIKDLAQLSYSAPRDQIRCREKLAFMRRYLGVSRLRPQDKRFIRQIVAKQTLMEWQSGKHP